MRTLRYFIVALTLLLTVSAAFAEEVIVEGGAAAISTVFAPIKEAFEASGANKLTIKLTNPAKAFMALHKGEVDLISVSPLTIDDSISKAKTEGIIIKMEDYQQQVIAQDKVVVFLNKANKVKKLSGAQLKGVFSGSISNWKELGGDDQNITVYWGDTPFLNRVFSKEVLAGAKVTDKAKKSGDIFALRENAISDPTAIVLSSNGLSMPRVKVPEIPLMPLPIVAVTKGAPSPKVQKLLEFYKNEFGYLSE